MNERITQLSLQATKKISFRLDPNTYKHIDDPEGDLERFEFDKEKFAELIVEECKDLLFESSENNRLPIAVDDMVHIIDTHFGVEE